MRMTIEWGCREEYLGLTMKDGSDGYTPGFYFLPVIDRRKLP
jgi:hypothetical protein